MTKLVSKRHPDLQEGHERSIYDHPLPEGLYVQLRAFCRSCDREFDYDGHPEDFDPDMAYCGRSSHCIP